MENLKAEMKKYRVTAANLAVLIGCSEKIARDKIAGLTDFTYLEARKIHDVYFPWMRMEYLFETYEGTRETA